MSDDTSLIASSFATLERLRDLFIERLYPMLGSQISPLLEQALVVFVMWTAARMALNPGRFKDYAAQVGKTMFGATLVFIMLGQDASESPVFTYGIRPLEGDCLALAKQIVSIFGVSSGGAGGSAYGSLAAVVEAQAYNVWKLCGFLFTLAGLESGVSSIGAYIYALFICTALIIPFVFVFVYFGFCLIEVMFLLLLAGSLSPLWLVAALFGATRSWAVNAAKIVANAVLIPPFLAVALGFTMSIIQPEIDRATSMSRCYEQRYEPGNCKGETVPDIYSYAGSNRFLLLVALGWVSVLCHVAARRKAAEITGSSDSGTAAALTTGAFSATAGLLKAAGYKGVQYTASAAQAAGGGLLAGANKAAELAQHFIGNGVDTSAPTAQPTALQPGASSRVASGPLSFSPDTTEALKQFTDAIKQFNQRFRG